MLNTYKKMIKIKHLDNIRKIATTLFWMAVLVFVIDLLVNIIFKDNREYTGSLICLTIAAYLYLFTGVFTFLYRKELKKQKNTRDIIVHYTLQSNNQKVHRMHLLEVYDEYRILEDVYDRISNSRDLLEKEKGENFIVNNISVIQN